MSVLRASPALVLTVTLAACGRTAVEQAQSQMDPGNVTLGQVTLPGTHGMYLYRTIAGTTADGSPYEVFAPDYTSWSNNSRRLAIYAHGYTDPIDYPKATSTSTYRGGGVQPYPEDVNPVLSTLETALVDKGFAFAWSAYNKPGYAIASGTASTNNLIDIADSALKKLYKKSTTGFLSSRRYVLGHSLGGVIGAQLAETQSSSRVSGVLAMCGPVNGMTQQVTYAGDLRALYDHYFQGDYAPGAPTHIPTSDPAFPAISPAQDSELKALGWSIVDAKPGDVTDEANGIFVFGTYKYTGLAATIAKVVSNNLVAAQEMADVTQLRLPHKTDEQLVHSIADALFYPIRGVRDASGTAGGSPFDNRLTTYLTASGTTVPESSTIKRYTPSTTAQSYVKGNYDTTGALKTYLLTLHTDQDPQVPYSHEANYLAKVKAKGKTWNFAQQYAPHYGHCAMTATETSNALQGLITWVESFGLIRPQTGLVNQP